MDTEELKEIERAGRRAVCAVPVESGGVVRPLLPEHSWP